MNKGCCNAWRIQSKSSTPVFMENGSRRTQPTCARNLNSYVKSGWEQALVAQALLPVRFS